MASKKEEYTNKLKSDLLRLCKERSIKCPQSLTKGEIVNLLVVEDQKKKMIPKKQHVKGKVLPIKPSVIQHIPIIQTYISMLRRGDDVTNDLRGFLDYYDWTGAESLKKSIEVGISDFSEVEVKVTKKKKKVARPKKEKLIELDIKPSPKKKKVVAPKYVPGEYESVEILSIQFGKKDEVLPKSVKKRERIAITLNELRKEIDNPIFIKSFTKSSKDLMKAKTVFYTRRLEDAQREYVSLQTKVKKLRDSGIAERTIEDMYPGYPAMGAFIVDLRSLIEIVKKKGEQITEEEIKEGLIEAIDDTEEGISSLIGRDEVKNQIASQLYSFSKGYKTFIGSFNNIAIYGSAGVGKTAIAKVIAFVFSKVGILAKDVVKIVTRTELVGQYTGQTAPRTRSVLIETLESVLFIDEAYQLTHCPEEKTGSKDFGGESVTEIVNFLDKYIGMSIVIVAGYEGVMTRCFMTFNEGLPRRFPYRYILSPYSDAELTDILISNLRRKIPDNIKIDDDTANFLYSMITKLRIEIPDSLKNQAGDMLNLSAQLNKAITSSFKIKWKNEDLGHNIPILLAGFDDFLNNKGYSVYG